MMEWLTDWLKQVILIILLAAFVDLLLPNQTMQRYVKTVVSLFILMVLLTPLFHLFQKQWSPDRLMAEAERLQTSGGSRLASTGGASQSLGSILAASRKLQADNGQDAKKLAEVRLSEEMKAGLEQSAGVKVAELHATIQLDNQGNPSIGTVRAILLHKAAQPTEAAAAAQASATSRPIGRVMVEPVKPVSIAVQPAPSVGGAVANASPSTEAGALSQDDGEVRRAAADYFKNTWELPPERLNLQLAKKE